MPPNDLPTFMQMLLAGHNWQEPQNHGHLVIHADVPPRIRAAIEFLQRLTIKTSDKAAPHGLGCEVINGQSLCKEEVLTQTAALVVLSGYFQGKLKECLWDRPSVIEPPQSGDPTDGLLGTTQCPTCQGHSSDCSICGGMGMVGMVKVLPTQANRTKKLRGRKEK